MRLIKAPAALRGRKEERGRGVGYTNERGLRGREGGDGRKSLSLPGRHVFFAVDRGDGDDENDKLFKAAAGGRVSK